jgi:uncharacterized protein (UPF0297 family)
MIYDNDLPIRRFSLMPSRGSILSFSAAEPAVTDIPRSPISTADRRVGAETSAADTLSALVHIICHSGMDPVTQLAGYLMTDDPTYLPESDHARLLADRIGRDKLLETLIEQYLKSNDVSTPSVETRS